MDRLNRTNWIYPDEERLTSITCTKQAVEYFNKLGKETKGMNAVDYMNFISINRDENTDRHR